MLFIYTIVRQSSLRTIGHLCSDKASLSFRFCAFI